MTNQISTGDEYDYFASYDEQMLADQDKSNAAALQNDKHYRWSASSPVELFRIFHRAGAPALVPSRVHWYPNMGNGKKGTLICRQLINESCPTCDFIAELEATGGTEERALAKELTAKPSWLCNVEAQSDPGKVKILEVGVTVVDRLIGSNPKKRPLSLLATVGDFGHPMTGYLVRVTKHEGSPWYTVEPVMDKATGRLAVRPAARELGPKLHDLTREVMVAPTEDHWTMVRYMRGEGPGLRSDNQNNGSAYKGIGNRRPAAAPAFGGQPPGLGNRPGVPVRAQSMVAPSGVVIPIDEGMFADPTG